MSQLGCVGSGDELQRQKLGTWSLGKRKAERMHLGEGEGERCGCDSERECAWGKEVVGKMGLLKERKYVHSVLRPKGLIYLSPL